MRAKWHLVRHGETDWNVKKRAQGSSDTLLNDKGRAQAQHLSNRLVSTPFTAAFASDLTPLRCYGGSDPSGPEHYLATTAGVTGKVLRRVGG